ncbi:hypothetical protein QBC37DRAFT_385970 [Rhypophila decipiens]|uniref:Endoplasmic reticulum junction formation protein lunapark n=1 Tax=Rhypophila decipiens TaxID=261697 RepID=A0AAN6YGU3_9PEZI|nr:hypothetical protein QBC37DRAFT_385970 [Rhypophila decipiens]
MVSFWPWRKDDSSPASFEKTLSALSTKIATTQTRLDNARSKSRRIKVLGTLYLGFAYLASAIVLFLAVGWKNMGALEWTGIAGGPVVIYLFRTLTTAVFDYQINGLTAKLKSQQAERTTTIQKLKEATRYDSTQELLEKYGGVEKKAKKAKKNASQDENDDEAAGEKKPQIRTPGRTNMPPPPTANIQRAPLVSAPGTPQPGGAHSVHGTPQHRSPAAGPEIEPSADFAPNAFDGRGPPPYMQYPPAATTKSTEPHWYDRILDTLLGEDETAAKNRIVLICGRCRLVNGQAPPGTKSLSELGSWKCMSCGAVNGEMDEGKRIVREVLGAASSPSKVETSDDEAAGSSSDMVEVGREDASAQSDSEGPEEQLVGRRRKGKET